MAIISTEAVVLKTLDYRETSKIAFFFTKKFGKVKGVLKGIRKDPRKFGSSLDKFSVNDIVFYHSSRTDFHLVSHCDMKEFFYDIRLDERKITAAEYGAEIVNKIMPVEERNPAVYDLLLDYFRSVGVSRRLAPLSKMDDLSRLVRMYQIKILSLSGFRPHIDSCVRCGKEIPQRARFSMRLGGLICGICQAGDRDTVGVTPGAIATLLYVEKHPWSACLRLLIPAVIQRELGLILNNFLIYHLGRHIRSAKYLS